MTTACLVSLSSPFSPIFPFSHIFSFSFHISSGTRRIISTVVLISYIIYHSTVSYLPSVILISYIAYHSTVSHLLCSHFIFRPPLNRITSTLFSFHTSSTTQPYHIYHCRAGGQFRACGHCHQSQQEHQESQCGAQPQHHQEQACGSRCGGLRPHAAGNHSSLYLCHLPTSGGSSAREPPLITITLVLITTATLFAVVISGYFDDLIGMELFNSFQVCWFAVWKSWCTINSKINGTSKSVYLPITKLHSILTVANLLAHNNITTRYLGK